MVVYINGMMCRTLEEIKNASNLVGIIESISPFEKTFNLSKWLQIIFFYFSLCYQSWYWLFKTI